MKQYDYSKLRSRITEQYKTIKAFTEAMGLTYPTVLAKLQSKSNFTQHDIEDCCELLKIPRSKINVYFFTLNVSQKGVEKKSIE